MASDDRRVRDLFDSLADVESPASWESPADLSRLSREVHAREAAGGVELSPSVGRTRLTGPGVVGHSAQLAPAGQFMTSLQRLVTAVGARLSGHKGARGPIPVEALIRTRLALNASPMPGSIIFEIDSASDIADERYRNGQIGMGDLLDEAPAELLVERSIRTVGEILRLAQSDDPEAVGDMLERMGPKVGAAAKELSDSLSSGAFDLELEWEPPGGQRIRTGMTRHAASFLSRVVDGRDLDAEVVELRGLLRTVTDAQPQIHIELADGEIVPINRNDVFIPREMFRERVIASVTERLHVKPDGRTSITRRLQAIEAEETLDT